MNKFGWCRPLLLSGISLGAEKIAEGFAQGHEGAIGIAVATGTVVAGAVGHFLLHVAHSEREKEERGRLALRNHHIRRGMVIALRRALTAVPKPPGDVYPELFKSWDEALESAATNENALEHLFPAEQFLEDHWNATNPYSPNQEGDARAVADLLREWLIPDQSLYNRWSKEEALELAKQVLPHYCRVFAEDLVEPDGLLNQAFMVKGINEIRALAQITFHLLQGMRAETRSNHDEVMLALGEIAGYIVRPPATTVEEIRWDIPVPRSFVGRDDYLIALHEDITIARGAPLAITGIAGMGKTETAKEYGKRFRKEYSAGFWVTADSPTNLVSSFAKIARNLLLPEKDNQDIEFVAKAAKRWLERNNGWLLVLDNAESMVNVETWLPEPTCQDGKQGHLLITTQMAAITNLADGRELKPMTPQEGANFLIRRGKLADPTEADWAAASQLSIELQGLPLALEYAGAFIEGSGYSIREYLDLYLKSGPELRAVALNNVNRGPVTETFSLVFSKLSERAKEIVRLCAFLSADFIPEEIIRAAAISDLAFAQAVMDAGRFSILPRDSHERALSIHRLVQAVTTDLLNTEERRSYAQRAVDL